MLCMKISTLTTSAAIFATAATAWGDITDPALIFEASTDTGSGSFVVTLDDGAYDGSGGWFWQALGDIQIMDGNGNLLVTLTQGSAFFQDDPVISLGFAVVAGNTDTQFSITSGTLSFDTIQNAEGRASAGMTLTESNGDTASITGLDTGGTMFGADYNGTTTFADLLEGPFNENNAFGTTTATDEFPNGGTFAAIGAVSDISSQWNFQLSANDQASGTSVFVVIPSPGALTLLGLAGFGAFRRHR